MLKKTALLIMVPVLGLAFGYGYVSFFLKKEKGAEVVPVPGTPTESTTEAPVKTDLHATLPPAIPADLPLGEKSEITQSYTLAYPDGVQSTVVLTSQRTPQGYYDICKRYLEESHWTIMNEHAALPVMSLYATKGPVVMNVTVSVHEGQDLTGTTTEASISVFNSRTP